MILAALVSAGWPTAKAHAQSDPHGGTFTLDEATANIPGKGGLTAIIETTKGKLTCRLFAAEAPLSVANFVGLARGLRAFLDPTTNTWVKRPYFDGLSFHRVIPGFMVQGGDLLGTGMGEAGYTIPNEISPGLRYDRPGLMGMANRGPNTNSAQFFITDGTPAHLNGGYTIFGECKPLAVVHAIASVKRGPQDRPLEPVLMKSVTIVRTKAGGKPQTRPPSPPVGTP